MSDDRPLLQLKNATKVYANGTVALQALSLTVRAGEFVSLVGASGCGKSTVLRAIAQLSSLTAGELHWSGDRPERDLAFVFQEAALMPWATVIENISLPLILAGMPRRQARAAAQAALHRVGLQGSERAYPRQLSGGMKMRVSIARALVMQPRVLLMDEPFGALDEITRGKLNEELLVLWQQQQWTTIFVTHNIYEAVYLSSRIVVLAASPGRVFAEVAIAAPYPRSPDFRTSVQCLDYCRTVSQHLQAAMSEVSV
ncbi:MAG: ABC transporter ATP-binding protein [Spirulinaceae cyanobacterium RM2_2_10]|nr:ABC transporter ATP-binding protein [Spirulinaceae cyanobacterium SM2_1_0]NJO19926.1 ABC transporter ATP-binding protein [Spirulinaceae cyanobacterium RM2_2_10]